MPLQDFLDLVNGNVCVLESVDRVSGAGNSTEVKIAADMVILVNAAKTRSVERDRNRNRRSAANARNRPAMARYFRRFREGSSFS